jgi:ribokinase
MKILNFGSLNIDYVYGVEHFVRPGETISSKSLDIFAGGKGLNQSIALARAGVPVIHAGAIGSDGDMLKELLDSNGVDTALLKKSEKRSGHAIIQVDPSGQNCILLYGGANLDMDTAYIKSVLSRFHKGDVILLQNEINRLSDIMREAHDRGILIYLNPSPVNGNINKLPLDTVDCFMLNEVEAADISGCSDEGAMLKKLRDLFPKATVVLTLGEKGSLCMENGRIYKQPAYSVQVVDTTAAGDTFTGYYIAAVAEGTGCKEALRRSSVAAALSVSKKGAAPSVPYLEEVMKAKLTER